MPERAKRKVGRAYEVIGGAKQSSRHIRKKNDMIANNAAKHSLT
ncbi:hypothetical protein [Paenalkalicoccus suaedae]|nr:hypothetical protein [Paenalkalicoccus suaedae]